MVQTNDQFSVIVIIPDISPTAITITTPSFFGISFNINTSQLGLIMNKQEEQKLRETIDSLLPMKEIAHNVWSAPRLFLLFFLLIVGTFVRRFNYFSTAEPDRKYL